MWLSEEGAPLGDALLEMLRPSDMALVIQRYTEGSYPSMPGMSWSAASFVASDPETGDADLTPEEARDVMLATAAGELETALDELGIDRATLRLMASPGSRTASQLRARGTLKVRRMGSPGTAGMQGAGQSAAADVGVMGAAMLAREARATTSSLTESLERANTLHERSVGIALNAIQQMGNQMVQLLAAVTGLVNAHVDRVGHEPDGDSSPAVQMAKIQAETDRKLYEEAGKAALPLMQGFARKFLTTPISDDADEDGEEEEE